MSNIATLMTGKCDFRILTSDRDLGDSAPFRDIETDKWLPHAGGSVFYATNSLRSTFSMLRNSNPEVIYLNSFFDPLFSIFPIMVCKLLVRRQVRIIIAPRGEFSRGALDIKRHKKRLFLTLARISGLYRDLTWHASTELEADDIRRAVGRLARDIRVAQDVATGHEGTVDSDSISLLLDNRIPLKLCFVSRISRKKNLDYALSILRDTGVPIEFNVYGPVEDETYMALCRSRADSMPAHVTVHFRGPLEHAQVARIMAQHHLFFFPTLGENFGHVIAESLSVGTPVLLSDQTPWLRLQQHGVGWDIPLAQPESFRAALRSLAAMDHGTYRAMRARAAAHSLNGNHSKAADEMLAVFCQASPP
ncbi:MAG: glycosyltransferase [Rhizobacter sp.]|nr:glycosyltransferase [Rhizobacter sp.]